MLLGGRRSQSLRRGSLWEPESLKEATSTRMKCLSRMGMGKKCPSICLLLSANLCWPHLASNEGPKERLKQAGDTVPRGLLPRTQDRVEKGRE